MRTTRNSIGQHNLEHRIFERNSEPTSADFNVDDFLDTSFFNGVPFTRIYQASAGMSGDYGVNRTPDTFNPNASGWSWVG